MAPSPEYDKEPKAPDKSATNISSEDTKLLHNLINDQHHNSDQKTTNSTTNSEVENNKHVETLDDDKLRALLNEALTYKCPKDREGKSSLFKELLEEVEQDDQEACEAAARTLTGCRGSRRGARGGRPALPHSNSLQDLVAALAAEPAPRRHHRHHPPAPQPATVAARAIHGGSLPSGVDTSSLLSEEVCRGGGAGYLATVRCVNPPPLAERRVSACDANAPHDLELINRRSKPMFPMTYTARATLEIGSGSVCSGRAVTTTTASNQVRTTAHPPAAPAPTPPGPHPAQKRLLSALRPRTPEPGGGTRGKAPRGPEPARRRPPADSDAFARNVQVWYEGLAAYSPESAPAARSRSSPPARYHDAPAREEPVGGRYCEASDHESLYYSFNRSDQRYSDGSADDVVERSRISHSGKSDVSVKRTYRERIVPKILPALPSINPKNIRSMSIGKPLPPFENVDSRIIRNKGAVHDTAVRKKPNAAAEEVTSAPMIESGVKEISRNDNKVNATRIDIESEISESMEDQTWKCFQMSDISSPPAEHATGGTDAHALNPLAESNDIELEEIVCHRATNDNRDTGSFSHFLADQEKLFQVLEASSSQTPEDEYSVNVLENNNNIKTNERSDDVEPVRNVSSESDVNMSTNIENDAITRGSEPSSEAGGAELVARRRDGRPPGDRYILAELPNNAYIFLTLPKRLLTPLNRRPVAEIADVAGDDIEKPRRKKDKPPVGTSSCSKRKDAIDKNALRVLLFENLLKSDRGSPTPGAAADAEVDSAIPFSCITTPEVVASCNTTSSASQAAVAVDPKPVVAAEPDASVAPAPTPAAPRARSDQSDDQPRSVIASSFNGLPLSRPNYGATTSGEDYKVPTHTIVPLLPSFVKSLDENGNSVQGYSSPLSGSSQHKKPRRKKSSKNETVIDCRQIDGYQGDKDVNELLRFIESNAERAPKLRKHKDDADDKGKKRSSDRRKDKEHKPTRASSLEELSRTKLEDLTAAQGKPERRSWGDSAPDAPADPPPAAEHADFQTVTKKRKPRRRTEEAAPRRARAPSPRRQDSAPPSDRSNDSNDDMDSVHSLPPPALPAPPPHASYADIARTRHNIPDLIESCNYYAEGEGEPQAPPAADPYPALDPRAEPPPPAAAARRAPLPARRKERAPPPPAPPAPPPDCPAPDVVADRRPPVILLDSTTRPRDMDGVTFGFDINEQLLGSGARRPRCDLVRDAVEAAPGSGVPVRAAKRALRYVPPPPPPDRSQLHQIVDFVGGAWEDVVRCGGGKVRYFSE